VNEFADKARPAELGDPATDRPLTLRVHPDDDPRDPNSRRVIKNDDTDGCAWCLVTGEGEGWDRYMLDEQVMHWPYTNHALASAAFRAEDEHRTLSVDYGDPLDTTDGIAPGRATCACGVSIVVDRRYDAAEWWREHRRQARNAVAQSAERGDLDERSFKGGTT